MDIRFLGLVWHNGKDVGRFKDIVNGNGFLPWYLSFLLVFKDLDHFSTANGHAALSLFWLIFLGFLLTYFA